jgi:peptidoglycan/xylan/chitin deacetylase (PgdA/CDA1 family)
MPVLAYHRVVASISSADPYGNCITIRDFKSQIQWLAWRGYHGVPLATLTGLFDEHSQAQYLPRRPLAITFDDGYEDFYSNAWPILARHGFNASVFLVSDAIGADNTFDAEFVAERAPMLSRVQVQKLAAAGVSFGSHSRSHPRSLGELPDDLLFDELEQSRTAIADLVGYKIEHFAYPKSQLDSRVQAAVAATGYTLACAGVGSRFEPLCVHRIDAARAGGGPGIEFAIWHHRLKWRLAAEARRHLGRLHLSSIS